MTTLRFNSIVVDLDGVLARYDGYKGTDVIGEALPQAKQLMTELKKKGHWLIVHTTRLTPSLNEPWTSVGLQEMVMDWLSYWEIPYDELWVKEGKPLACVYLDDRAVCVDSHEMTTEDGLDLILSDIEGMAESNEHDREMK